MGGATAGQAPDEFSGINMLGGVDLAVELKCQRMLSCCKGKNERGDREAERHEWTPGGSPVATP